MSQQFFSINKGQFKTGDVTTATSSPSADFYFQISTINTPTKKDAILAMKEIMHFIESNGIDAGQVGTNLPVL